MVFFNLYFSRFFFYEPFNRSTGNTVERGYYAFQPSFKSLEFTISETDNFFRAKAFSSPLFGSTNYYNFSCESFFSGENFRYKSRIFSFFIPVAVTFRRQAFDLSWYFFISSVFGSAFKGQVVSDLLAPSPFYFIFARISPLLIVSFLLRSSFFSLRVSMSKSNRLISFAISNRIYIFSKR